MFVQLPTPKGELSFKVTRMRGYDATATEELTTGIKVPAANYIVLHSNIFMPVETRREAEAITRAIETGARYAEDPKAYDRYVVLRLIREIVQRKPDIIVGYQFKQGISWMSAMSEIHGGIGYYSADYGLRVASAPLFSSRIETGEFYPDGKPILAWNDYGPCGVFLKGTVKAHRRLIHQLQEADLLTRLYDGVWDSEAHFVESRSNVIKYDLEG